MKCLFCLILCCIDWIQFWFSFPKNTLCPKLFQISYYYSQGCWFQSMLSSSVCATKYQAPRQVIQKGPLPPCSRVALSSTLAGALNKNKCRKIENYIHECSIMNLQKEILFKANCWYLAILFLLTILLRVLLCPPHGHPENSRHVSSQNIDITTVAMLSKT